MTRYVSVSTFSFLVSIPIGITSFAVELEIYAITAGIKKYKSIIKKRKNKKHVKMVVLAKTKLNTIEFLIYSVLISSNINHN